MTQPCSEKSYFQEAYEAGQQAAKQGASPDSNPHKQSFHERDETTEDLAWWCWESGYDDPEKPYDRAIYE